MKTVIILIALSLCACASSATKRPKANLAIDSEVTPPPAREERDDLTVTRGEDSPPEGEIDLGMEGGAGPVTIDSAMSAEEENAALESGVKKKDDKKKKSDKDDEEDDKAEPEEEVDPDE